MASKKTLNAKNLEALGAPRLAELLMEISTGSALAKRRLKMEIAGADNPGDLAHELSKRLTTIARSRSYIDWRKRKTLIVELDAQRRSIAEQMAATDPAKAHELMWQFLGVANPVLGRTSDNNAAVIEVFRAAIADLVAITERGKIAPAVLADRLYEVLFHNAFGQFDGLIASLAPVLGPKGLDHLRHIMGEIVAGDGQAAARKRVAHAALKAIADAQGDIDGFIAQHSAALRRTPVVATEIATRLLSAGRAPEAWTAINAVDQDRSGWVPVEWEMARLAVLDALGREEEAQAGRLAGFRRSLNPDHLRSYLKKLPDFDDVEAEDEAMAFALDYPSATQALTFFLNWPNLQKAADLVLKRSRELDGDQFDGLTASAEFLSSKYPLAAAVALRVPLEYTLKQGRANRYKQALETLAELERLDLAITDYAGHPSHAAFMSRLQSDHARRQAFWALF